jgi:NitT/TauT family transport system substrate-binding protein
VLSGDVQVAGNIWPFVALAGSQGLPIKTVSALAAGGTTVEDDDQQLVVLASTDIKTSADLAGKTVAINTLNGLSEFGVRAIARNEGADADAIKVTPVLFPNMLGVLRAGSVDAAAMIEPFLTLAKQEEDIRVIGGINVALQSESPTGIMVMSNDYIEKNPDVVARFQAATKKAVAYTADEANRAEIVQLLIKYTRTPPDIAEKMTLPRFVDHHDIAKVQDQIDLYVKAGVIEKELDMSEFDAQAPAQ